MVGCETSFQIWAKLKLYFMSKIKQFKTQLQNTKKGSSTINEYILKIKNLVDSLASVACHFNF